MGKKQVPIQTTTGEIKPIQLNRKDSFKTPETRQK